MYERLCAARLHTLARRFPAVVIVGARQAGKTTLARATFPGYAYVDLEDPRTAQRFRDDPRLSRRARRAPGTRRVTGGRSGSKADFPTRWRATSASGGKLTFAAF